MSTRKTSASKRTAVATKVKTAVKTKVKTKLTAIEKKALINRILGERTTLQLASASMMYIILNTMFIKKQVPKMHMANTQTALSDYVKACKHRDNEFQEVI